MTQTTTNNFMALDVGGKRIGVAVASAQAKLPRPLTTLINDDHIFDTIKQLMEQEQVNSLVIGLPRGLDGQETEQTRSIYSFGDDLKQKLSVPVFYQDEAVTSRQAKEMLQTNAKPYNKADIDSLAATYILGDYLREQERAI